MLEDNYEKVIDLAKNLAKEDAKKAEGNELLELFVADCKLHDAPVKKAFFDSWKDTVKNVIEKEKKETT